MIEEKFRQAVAEALAPLVERLEALEAQARLQEAEPVDSGLRTEDPRHPLAPAQYASGGFIHGGSGDLLPTAEPEEPAPKTPARKRPSRAKSPSAPDA